MTYERDLEVAAGLSDDSSAFAGNIANRKPQPKLAFSKPQPRLSWYGIRVRPRFERVVSTALSDKGYEEFLPRYRSLRVWSDRSKELELPLFPGYLFCRFDVQGCLLPILKTPGVISIICLGRMPVSIPDNEIEAIQAVIRAGFPIQPWPRLAIGTKVLIEKGPLAGIEGVALDVNKRYRLILSIPLMQRSVAVEIDRHWARPIYSGIDPGGISPALSARHDGSHRK